MFLLAILIPACASSSLAFHMMYSAYKLNKQGDNIQPWCAPFPIWNQSVVQCLVLTVDSLPAYRFLRRQVRWSGSPISWRIFHSLLWSTQFPNTWGKMSEVQGEIENSIIVVRLCYSSLSWYIKSCEMLIKKYLVKFIAQNTNIIIKRAKISNQWLSIHLRNLKRKTKDR